MTTAFTPYFRPLLEQLRIRTSRAYLSFVAPASPPLRKHLDRLLSSPAGSPESVMASPVFEARFSFPSCGKTLEQLASQGLLLPQLVEAMSPSPAAFAAQRMPRELQPYRHQLEAWQHLLADDVRSVVISTGTGSGKTECFLVPILQHLVQKLEAGRTLTGVQALFLYPLNALINSQRERLAAWTHAFNGRLRYCLYNGNTPDSVPQNSRKEYPQEVLDRVTLRDTPPPILVTNATMLEYMLVRPVDAPILQKSQGKLRYIVLDEAHTYLGSSAAELALQLRRVMLAFGVQPEQVRFIATSATLSSPDGDVSATCQALREFLAAVSGQSLEQVKVVTSTAQIPELPPDEGFECVNELSEVANCSPAERFELLCQSPVARTVRKLISQRPRSLHELQHDPELQTVLRQQGITPFADLTLLELLELGTTALRTLPGDETEAFLPLRGHFFLRTQAGLWACCNPHCQGREGTLSDTDWPFGKVYTAHRLRCGACESQVYDLYFCTQCGTEYLAGEIKYPREVPEGKFVPTAPPHYELPGAYDAGGLGEDTDSAEIAPASTEAPAGSGESASDESSDSEERFEEDDDSAEDEPEPPAGPMTLRLVGPPRAIEAEPLCLEPSTGRISGDGTPILHMLASNPCRCTRCGGVDCSPQKPLFRPARSGGEFLLRVAIPTLLEFMPELPKAKTPANFPHRGRQLITFTDSRQGTARFSSLLSVEAERGYVRSFIYHQVWAAQTASSVQSGDLEEDLNDLKERYERTPNPRLKERIEQKQQELERTRQSTGVKLEDLCTSLHKTPELGWMHERRRDYDPYHVSNMSAPELARLLVLRELLRRPFRRTSLETLGLVQMKYPELGRLRRSIPNAWSRWGGSSQEWEDFLKLCIDFFIRPNSALVVDSDLFRWINARIRPSLIRPSGEEKKKDVVFWPKWYPKGRASRLALLLLRAFKETDSPETREHINGILESAWQALRPLLKQQQDGAQFDLLERAELHPVRRAWLCPVTRGLLDVTLRQQTPYQLPLLGENALSPRERREIQALTLCRTEVNMPALWAPFHQNADGRSISSVERQRWLESSPELLLARQQGAWTEQSDRLAEYRPYFRVAEHSAQLSAPLLRRYEERFKEAQLNVLSCSTTMEMGVDIGGLNGVALNNAPPGPANFLQRVGRAGRRKETRAVSLTICRTTPHESSVFANPLWPFRTPIYVTEVKLESRRIVQRHVNALLLQFFLQQDPEVTQAHTFTVGSFFAPEVEAGTPVDRFIQFLSRIEALSVEQQRAVETLVRSSVCEGIDLRTLMDQVKDGLLKVKRQLKTEYDTLQEQLNRLPKQEQEQSPAAMSIYLQRRRLLEEYLLSYLAAEQFLPGYGFPTNVVPLIHTTMEELKAEKDRRERELRDRRQGARTDVGHRREDNLIRREYPTRSRAMAIREYAPGSEVVFDGRAYRSGGVTLNWHLPPELDNGQTVELQSFKTAWRCRICGSVGFSTTVPAVCPGCDHTESQDLHFCLEPNGFAVDIREKAESDVGSRTYIPVQEPWLSAGSEPLSCLGNPAVLRFRYSSEGQRIQLSGGLHQQGYAICLRCGRAEPEAQPAGASSSPPLKDHRPLRGGKATPWDGKPESLLCGGPSASPSIKRHYWLGGVEKTDVLEIRLSDPATGKYPSKKVALTLAVALRIALAEKLGIEERELGFGTAPRREGSRNNHVIFLCDTATGGAGFCGEALALLPELLRMARKRLQECPRHCDSVCQACLLGHETSHSVGNLNRHEALAFLTEEMLNALVLPDTDKRFGERTRMEWQTPLDALERHLRRFPPIAVRLFLGGSLEEWDLGAWAGLPLLFSRGTEAHVALVIPPRLSHRLDWTQCHLLAGLAGLPNVTIAESTTEQPWQGSQQLYAEIQRKDKSWWGCATDAAPALVPDGGWLKTPPGNRNTWGPLDSATDLRPIATAQLQKPLPGSLREVRITEPVNTRWPLPGVGSRLWDRICLTDSGLKAWLPDSPAESLTYEDRYLNSPLAVACLYDLLKTFLESGVIGPQTQVKLSTLLKNKEELPYPYFDACWGQDSTLKTVLQGLLNTLVTRADVQVRADKQAVAHARTMLLSWADGRQLTLRLDHGFGFLGCRGEPFDFKTTPQQQLCWIMKHRTSTVFYSSHPVLMYVGRT